MKDSISSFFTEASGGEIYGDLVNLSTLNEIRLFFVSLLPLWKISSNTSSPFRRNNELLQASLGENMLIWRIVGETFTGFWQRVRSAVKAGGRMNEGNFLGIRTRRYLGKE